MRMVSTLSSVPVGEISVSMAQIDSLISSLSSEAGNCRQILAMSVAGHAFQTAKAVGVLVGLGSKLSSVLGVGVEAATFGGATRLFSANDEVPGTFFENWRRDLVHFTMLKTVGVVLASHNALFRHGAQGLGMMLGSDATAQLGWTSKEEGSFAERLVHGVAMSVSLEAGSHLLRLSTGNTLERIRSSAVIAQSFAFARRMRPSDLSERVITFSSDSNSRVYEFLESYQEAIRGEEIDRAASLMEPFGEICIRFLAQRLACHTYLSGHGANVNDLAWEVSKVVFQRVDTGGLELFKREMLSYHRMSVRALTEGAVSPDRASSASPEVPVLCWDQPFERLSTLLLPSQLLETMLSIGMDVRGYAGAGEAPTQRRSNAAHMALLAEWVHSNNRLPKLREVLNKRFSIEFPFLRAAEAEPAKVSATERAAIARAFLEACQKRLFRHDSDMFLGELIREPSRILQGLEQGFIIRWAALLNLESKPYADESLACSATTFANYLGMYVIQSKHSFTPRETYTKRIREIEEALARVLREFDDSESS